ncbi:MAG TPA: CHAT domain-containing protein [Pyrinomonadaceae bacterium]|nr:CHAT domain-containing protein [Pyrinomonadaceae bacterium]
MSSLKRSVSHSGLAALMLCLLCLGSLPTSQAQGGDEAEIRALVERFFAAYQREAIADLISLWSEKSDHLAASRQSLQQTFNANRNIEVKSLGVGEVTIDGNRGKAQLVVEVSALDEKSGKAAEGFGKMAVTMRVVREATGWKVWQYSSASEEFAADLLAAGTEEARVAMLTSNPERVTTALVRELNKQGRALFSQNRFEQAIAVYDVALAAASRIEDKTGTALVLIGVGNAHYLQGNYDKAAEAYGRSLKLSEETGIKPDIARALSSMAGVHRSRGDYQQSLEAGLKSLRLREEMGDKVGIATSLSNIAGVYYGQGRYELALEYQTRALSMEEELGDKSGVATGLNNLASLYVIQGDYLRALEARLKSLKMREEMGDKASIALLLNNLGHVYFMHGDYEQALDFYRRGLQLSNELGMKAVIAMLFTNMGNVYYARDDYAQAADFMLKSLKLHEEIGDKAGHALILSNLGAVYNDQGDHARALETLQRSLKLAEEIGLGQIVASSLTNIAQTYQHLGQPRAAIDFASRAVAHARREDNADILWQALTTEGRVYASLGQMDNARQSFLGAIAVIEKLRGRVAGGDRGRQRFFEGKVSPYYAMVDLLLKQGETVQALTYAERAKGRVLLDVLSNGKADINKAMTKEELDRDRALTTEINGLNTQISRLKAAAQRAELPALTARLDKARLEYEAFQSGLYTAHPELRVKRGEAHALTLGEADGLLAGGSSALLEYVVGENNSYLFVLTKGAGRPVDLKVYPLGLKGKELAGMSQDFLRRVAERDLMIKSPAERLYELLVKPAEKQLQGVSSLTIVPDGPLWDIPFQALHRGRRGYLLEGYTISYAPSLSVLREMKRKGAELHRARAGGGRTATESFRTGLLALGNPVVGGVTAAKLNAVRDDDSLSPLPDAEREVNTLGKLYGPARSRVLVGERATEEEVKAEGEKYRLLHFATHALLDDRNPMYSRILLSQAGRGADEDGLLEAWELMRLDLTAELAVLSACQTARGRVGAGEGMIGISWALFVAGCPAVVVSQWKVDSARTTDLMLEFHRNLLRRKGSAPSLTKAEALREASLKLLHSQYNHPAYWAGFVLIGNEK